MTAAALVHVQRLAASLLISGRSRAAATLRAERRESRTPSHERRKCEKSESIHGCL
jgi:hypothetical protein